MNLLIRTVLAGFTPIVISSAIYRITINWKSLPKELPLSQNYPNPFNPTTTIKYDLPSQAHVTVKVLDVLDKEIATLVDEQQPAGYKSVEWNALNIATGVYFYHLQVGSFSQVGKMLLMK